MISYRKSFNSAMRKSSSAVDAALRAGNVGKAVEVVRSNLRTETGMNIPRFVIRKHVSDYQKRSGI